MILGIDVIKGDGLTGDYENVTNSQISVENMGTKLIESSQGQVILADDLGQ